MPRIGALGLSQQQHDAHTRHAADYVTCNANKDNRQIGHCPRPVLLIDPFHLAAIAV
ncbi:hypothetical protein [Sphingobium phenoxybenzoativorans]|uniref:hypothetical protein n=1 Tax=Sphingobium phenoxybenzoativorans TaxID=1592790 RepID=UPI001495A3BC|nr:hypothetical protein [Sphingobium phenoxybenzoativorans]